eukprot:3709044-Prymnesium_polylepis.1
MFDRGALLEKCQEVLARVVADFGPFYSTTDQEPIPHGHRGPCGGGGVEPGMSRVEVGLVNQTRNLQGPVVDQIQCPDCLR